MGKQTAMLVKNIRLKGALVFALSMLVFPASAQQTTKKAPPTKTAPGVVDPFGFDDPQHAGQNRIRLFGLARNVIEHSGEVYGQLSGYYRAGDMIPPESRPKKAAEEIKPTLPGGKIRTYYLQFNFAGRMIDASSIRSAEIP